MLKNLPGTQSTCNNLVAILGLDPVTCDLSKVSLTYIKLGKTGERVQSLVQIVFPQSFNWMV